MIDDYINYHLNKRVNEYNLVSKTIISFPC